AELGPLPTDSFAVMAEVAAGLGCPGRLRLIEPVATGVTRAPAVVLPGAMTCFALQVFGFGGAAFAGVPGDEHLRATLLGFDTVEIAPQGLEDAIDCYASLVVQLGILPGLAIPSLRFVKDLLRLLHVVVEPSLAVPQNP